MENECRISNGIGDDRLSPLSLKIYRTSSPVYSSSSSSSSSPFSGRLSVGCTNCIEHHVSKFDTLAGVAIKYGVEVSDIKKINGLVTDLQMFARKTLCIPLPGRHPPSPIIANGFHTPGTSSSTEHTPPSRRRDSHFFSSFQSLKLTSPSKWKESPAMNNLRGYYGLKPPDQEAAPKGWEMNVYQRGGSHYLEDGQFGKPSPHMNPPLSVHRKSRSATDNRRLENGNLANSESVETAGRPDVNKWISNLRSWNQKSEANFKSRAPEMLLKGDTTTSNGGFSKITSKGLALRQKAASRTASGIDGETGLQSSISTTVEDSLSGVKKSSSMPSFQDSDCTSSIWPAVNWSLKPDLQVFSTVAITRPIYESFPKPITSRRNKTAVD